MTVAAAVESPVGRNGNEQPPVPDAGNLLEWSWLRVILAPRWGGRNDFLYLLYYTLDFWGRRLCRSASLLYPSNRIDIYLELWAHPTDRFHHHSPLAELRLARLRLTFPCELRQTNRNDLPRIYRIPDHKTVRKFPLAQTLSF